MKKLFTICKESISFQPDKLFKLLIKDIENLKDLNNLKDEDFYKSKELLKIAGTIKDETGIYVELYSSEKPSVDVPALSAKNVLNRNNDFISLIDSDKEEDTKKLLYELKKPVIEGTVNLSKSKVTGDFCKIKNMIGMPRRILQSSGIYTPNLAAAVILHELGHVFVFMEFLSRTVSTNQVLAAVTRSLDKRDIGLKRNMLLTVAADTLNMSKEKRDILFKAENSQTATVIMIDAASEKCRSELGKSVYDNNSFEFLADQFAAKHGAGRDLVIAMDDVEKSGSYLAINLTVSSAVLASILYLSPLSPALWLTVIASCFSVGVDLYDTPKDRFERIKHTLIDRLKDKSLSKEIIQNLQQQIIDIENIISNYTDNRNVIELLAYYIRPSYRDAQKYEKLQKQLEKLANNDLFAKAALLKTI